VTGADADSKAAWIWNGAYYQRAMSLNPSKVELRGPIKIQDFVVDGKLTLSLRNYLDLVLANNTDVEIQRVTLETPKNAIQRAFGVFDPIVNSNFQANRSTTPTTNTLQGANILSTLTQPFSMNYQQLLPTSTNFQGGITTRKFSTNDAFANVNPSFNTTVNFQLSQPLLRNFGPYLAKLPVTIARAQLRTQELNFRDSIYRLLVTSENAYWDVVGARERLKVQEQALQLADTALKRAQRELELGATSPLEIYQPQQQYATAEIGVAQVRFDLQRFEDVLRRQIGADLDTQLRLLPIVLTEDVNTPPDTAPFNKEEIVTTAVKLRPDLSAARNNIDVNDYQIQSSKNQLRPNLTLTGGYTSNGVGGTRFIRNPGQPTVVIPGGIGDAWGQTFGFDFPTWQMGINLQLPLRDRRASADLADAVVNKRLNTLRERSLEQQVRQEVLNAITLVESSREGVKLAQIALDFAQKRVEADQKRYDLGVINIFFLLSAQTDLTNAQSNLVNQTVQYKRNMLQLQQRVGNLLEAKGVVLQ
jgi:outer membrane protein TolC